MVPLLCFSILNNSRLLSTIQAEKKKGMINMQPREAKCENCSYSIFDEFWGEYKCTSKKRVCNESELLMACSDYRPMHVRANEPKPEIYVRSGATFTPHISDDGVLSWTNDKDLKNPPPVKLQAGRDGKDGADGKDGKDGYTPVKGVDYFDGRDGVDGKDGEPGKDGYTPVKGVDYFDGEPGEPGKDGPKGDPGEPGEPGKDGYTPVKGVDYFDGKPGKDGKDGADGPKGDPGEPGKDGKDGADGFSPTVAVEDIDGGHRVTITDADGSKTFEVKDGKDGQGGSGGAAIIDVIELPTENIRDDCFYRLLTGSFVGAGNSPEGWIVYVVENLPEVGEPVTTDMENVTAYYNVSDGDAYGYINDALGSQAGVPAGWYTLSMLTPVFGIEWGGVTTNIFDSVENNMALFVLLERVIWQYSGEWVTLKNVGRVGAGHSAEIFNTAKNVASGIYSHAEGFMTVAGGYYSHTEGTETSAGGEASHAECLNTSASGKGAHAEGYMTYANGRYTHAEGYGSMAEGDCSHAEGFDTITYGESSHAEGYITVAKGSSSHAEGSRTTATGDVSHAEGIGTISVAYAQHTQGAYNIVDPAYNENFIPGNMGKYLHIIGNGGSDNDRSNAHTLDWDGNAWYAGYVEGTAMILKSPDGARWRVTVDNEGKLTTNVFTD